MKATIDEQALPRSRLAALGDLLTPDIFANRSAGARALSATAWLDGLRGWAAFCVCFMHLTVYTHEGLELCYGSKYRHSDEFNTSPVALPIIRIPFVGGHFAVMLFFVISGYVVPRRMLQLLQEGRKMDFFEALKSAMIRRPVRLFLPVILSTAAFAVSWHILGIRVPWPKQQSNIVFEAWAWLQETSVFVYFFRIGWLYTIYNVHSWTIPVEFRGSVFMFIFLFLVHNVSTRIRLIAMVVMFIHLSVGSPGAWYACFFAGMFLSEMEMLSQSNAKETNFWWDKIDAWLRARKPLRTVVLHVALFVSLYLASQPSADWSTKADTLGNCPGWITLSRLIPKCYYDLDAQYRWFWLFWAAFLMVYVVREIHWLRRCFETSFAQYLGKHSFALYLIHGPMIAIFSERLFYLTGVKQMWKDEHREMYSAIANKWLDSPYFPFGSKGYAGLEPNFLFCVAVSIPLFLYLAEIGTRAFDTPSVTASKWLWRKWQAL